jgi:branched-chain amino acid transport system substrate-binding protein
MKRRIGVMGFFLVLGFVFSFSAYAADPIVIGVPTSTGFVEGKEGLAIVEMAVAEINAKGGVKVGSEKRMLKVESIDIRDAAPGVPRSSFWKRSLQPSSSAPSGRKPCLREWTLLRNTKSL